MSPSWIDKGTIRYKWRNVADNARINVNDKAHVYLTASTFDSTMLASITTSFLSPNNHDYDNHEDCRDKIRYQTKYNIWFDNEFYRRQSVRSLAFPQAEWIPILV